MVAKDEFQEDEIQYQNFPHLKAQEAGSDGFGARHKENADGHKQNRRCTGMRPGVV